MLPPHLPQNAIMRPLHRAPKPLKVWIVQAAPLERPAIRNIRLELRGTAAALRPELRILREGRARAC